MAIAAITKLVSVGRMAFAAITKPFPADGMPFVTITRPVPAGPTPFVAVTIAPGPVFFNTNYHILSIKYSLMRNYMDD
jgi:hypothetical protein